MRGDCVSVYENIPPPVTGSTAVDQQQTEARHASAGYKEEHRGGTYANQGNAEVLEPPIAFDHKIDRNRAGTTTSEYNWIKSYYEGDGSQGLGSVREARVKKVDKLSNGGGERQNFATRQTKFSVEEKEHYNPGPGKVGL